MADEPRRSGRATKGHHSKNDTPEPQKKGKKGKKGQKEKSEEPEPEPDEDETIIRCVCGYVVEDPRDKRAMICCDRCEAWQHNVHMGLSEDDDELPDQYFCEQCKPEDHKELLDAIARGDNIWETREADVKAAKQASRKKGKGGRKSTTADKDAANSAEPSVIASPAPPAEPKQETGQKRKLQADSPGDSPTTENAGNKIRKTSTQKSSARQSSTSNAHDQGRRDSQPVSTTLQTELVDKIDDLNEKARRAAAAGLRKTFTEAANEAVRAGTFTVPAGQDLPLFAEKLALNVEYALYMNLWARGATSQPEYGMQFRTIMHNVKQNPELRDKLFNNLISPLELSKMTSDQMQSQEMQQKTAEWKKQIEKQSVLSNEPGQYIRITHKGEELVERFDDHKNDNSDSHQPVRSLSLSNDDHHMNDGPSSPRDVELPVPENNRRPQVDIRKLSIDTKRRTSHGHIAGRKPSATFDVGKVWSSVESPSTPARPTPSEAHRATPSNARADPDIDRLLKDENEDDDEYEPADHKPDPDTIWAGTLMMATVAELRATAKFVGGANLSQVYPWPKLMPPLLSIEGRIEIELAEQYLCSLQYSKSKDLTIVALTPADHQEDKDNFNKLFDYFTSRKRYGVIRVCPVENVRDIYVVPLEAGDGSLPSFMMLLQDTLLEVPRKTRALLIAYVINCTESSPNAAATGATNSIPAQASTQAASHRSNSTPQHMSPAAPTPQQSPYSNIPPNPYAQSPSAPQTHFVPPSQPNPAYPPQYQMPPQPNGGVTGAAGGTQGLRGMAAAIHILGEMANSRAVHQLLQSSPNTGVNEFGHIKDVFISNPDTRNDLEILLPVLQAKLRPGS